MDLTQCVSFNCIIYELQISSECSLLSINISHLRHGYSEICAMRKGKVFIIYAAENSVMKYHKN